MATEAPPSPRREAVGPTCLAGSLALLLAVCAPAAGVEIEVRGQLVAIRAQEEPLRTVLEAVAERCDLEIRSNIPTPEHVTVVSGPRPLPRLLKSLLRDHSYVLQYSDDGGGARSLWILGPAGDGDIKPAWSIGPRDRSLDALVLALADPDTEVRLEAVLALGDIGSREVERFLTQSLADESDDVREAARAVLEDRGMAEAGLRAAEPGAD